MNINIKIINKILLRIENQIKARTPVRTGFLKGGLHLEWRDGSIVFYSLAPYGRYVDEGTWRGRSQTKESKRAWGTKEYKDNSHEGYRGRHFTEPLKQLSKEEIVREIKPEIITVMREELLKTLKKI
jgi:hypothetical protein